MLSTLDHDVSKSNGHEDISANAQGNSVEHDINIILLTRLFNILIKLGELPDEWKVARVSPIPKSGRPSNPANYYPISLLSTFRKAYERINSSFSVLLPSLCSAMGFHPGKISYWSSSGCN
jgi:hypothetical protein